MQITYFNTQFKNCILHVRHSILALIVIFKQKNIYFPVTNSYDLSDTRIQRYLYFVPCIIIYVTAVLLVI